MLLNRQLSVRITLQNIFVLFIFLWCGFLCLNVNEIDVFCPKKKSVGELYYQNKYIDEKKLIDFVVSHFDTLYSKLCVRARKKNTKPLQKMKCVVIVIVVVVVILVR